MNWKPLNKIEDLEPGDIIRNKGEKSTFQVTANYGTRATAVRTADVTNPGEWEVLETKPVKRTVKKLNRMRLDP